MKTLLLIDANALIHRSFHALPPLTSLSGEPVGAIYGLSSTLLKVLREEPPDYVAAAFDRPEPTFRDEIFKEYKAQRPKAPNELISQIIKARELIEKFGIKAFEKAGWEADDLIGTLAEKFKKENNLKIIILTGDLDTLQLVENDKVVVKTLKKGVSETMVYNEAAVKERYGLLPSQLTDYKALVGDASDNIPGVPGIGPKTASQILNKHQNIEKLYEKIEEDGLGLAPAKEKKIWEKLLVNKEKAFLAKKLTTINREVEIETNLEALSYEDQASEELKNYFENLGFQSLIKRMRNQEPKSFLAAGLEERTGDSERKDFGDAGFNLKDLIKKGKKFTKPLFDIGVAAWLIDPDLKDYSPQNLAKKFLRKELADENEIAPLLLPFFVKKLREYQLEKVFWEIEMPLVEILAEMEMLGIGIDTGILGKLGGEIGSEIKTLEEKIWKEAGEEFNLNSPKQLVEVLNRRFNLSLKSTAAEKLETLKAKHPIMDLVLDYREDFKIKSTYVEPLINLTGKDGRLHTTFNQTGTATGRLSSSEPNMQNIPQESKWAPRIRSAFVAAPGFKLVSFDYSQLELRILASVSGDEKLKEAFFNHQDVHKLTASQVFNVPLDGVTSDMRRLGKTLNFGVMYGMGADAFSRTSGLKKEEAKKFIQEYFADFPGVKKWQEETIKLARTLGYVTNLNARRRWLFNIQDFNPQLQAEAERIAVNMPIQSLEADIIKLAMIKIYESFKEREWWPGKARLLLSIHDELLFEVGDDILKEAQGEIKRIMESVYTLSVPLTVESAVGSSWDELK